MSRSTPLSFALIAATIGWAVPAAPLLLAAPASAQPTPKPADKIKTAKEYTDAGLAAQSSGDYPTALIFYQKAYELVPHPLLLFNMAQVYRLAGDETRAAEHYHKYLDADPDGPKAKLTRELLAPIDARLHATDAEWLAAEQTRLQIEARATEAAQQAEAQRQADEAARAEAARSAVVDPSPPEREPEPAQPAARGGGLRIAGLATVGVGVVGVGVGLAYFGRKAKSLSDELSMPGVRFDQGKYDDGTRANRMTIGVTAAGGALVVGGVVLYLISRKHARPVEQVTLVPSVGTRLVGLSVMGTLP